MSNSVKDQDQRRRFVLDMLKEPMGVWVGEEVTSAVSSPDVSDVFYSARYIVDASPSLVHPRRGMV